jgi:O-succinylbenzoate synthase
VPRRVGDLAETCEQILDLGAASIINIKPGRVGGYLESVAIHDLCREREVAVWCGGMLETGIGRAANLALASLPGFVLPGDTSASSRYYARDVTTPFVLDDEGFLDVPTGAGAGVTPDAESLAALEVWRTPLVRDGVTVGRE